LQPSSFGADFAAGYFVQAGPKAFPGGKPARLFPENFLP
jgi:hypothetical protein